MTLVWTSLTVLLLARAGHAAWRLWHMLPRQNADFGWAAADMWGRP